MTLPQVTSLIGRLIWPAVVLTIIFLYRAEILELGRRLAERVSHLSFAGVSIDLISASEAPGEAVSAVADFVQASPGPGVASSDAGTALQAAIVTSGAGFVTIHLH